MKSWSFSLALLLEYLLTFQLWRTFPNRSAYLAVGGLAVIVMSAGIRRAARRGYFPDRPDLVLHGLVIVDVALETASYEVFHAASQCLLCVPADASIFHNNFNFCGCAAVFGVLIGGYHGWALHKLRTTVKPSPVSAGPDER